MARMLLKRSGSLTIKENSHALLRARIFGLGSSRRFFWFLGSRRNSGNGFKSFVLPIYRDLLRSTVDEFPTKGLRKFF